MPTVKFSIYHLPFTIYFPFSNWSIRKLSNRQISEAFLRIIGKWKLDNGKWKSLAGFTLIEFLVVLGVLGLAIGSALILLTSVLRGTNQANITAEVKQNGQAVLDTLDSQIRNGRDVIAISPPAGASSAIQVTLADGTYLYLACFGTAGTTSNGWIGRYISPSNSIPSPGSYASLTNKDSIFGVDIVCESPCPSACTFGVPAPVSTLNPPLVNIVFSASQGVSAPSRQDFRANVRFETTISLRRY